MKKKPNIFRGVLVYVALLALIFALVGMIGSPNTEQPTQLTYSELLSWVEADLKADMGLPLSKDEAGKTLTHVQITGTTLIARKGDSAIAERDFGSRYDIVVTIPSETQFYADVSAIYKTVLNRENVSPTEYTFAFNAKAPEEASWFVQFLPYLLVSGLSLLLIFYLFRQTTNANKGVMSFAKSRAKLNDASKNKTTFADVAGADEEKAELQEIVEFLKNPQKFTEVGARIPKGVILVGPPGTGKTLLARAVAGEAGVPFFSISGSDFLEMFVGVGASRMRDLFDQARKAAPSIVFIDEIDAVGRRRGSGLGGGHDEREQTLNQLLVEMDGFSANSGIIVMAATNRVDILDPALLRPGRFDRKITVNAPDLTGREAILKVHARNKPLAEDVDLAQIARQTPLCTGADLENILNESAILTARAGEKKIRMATITAAITRVQLGPEKRSHKQREADVRHTAYHEAGHAVAAYYTEGCDPVTEVSIIPRGSAGGYTISTEKEEVSYYSAKKLRAQIIYGLGGRCAEQIVFDELNTGAASDIKHVTRLARVMVTEYGMSEKIGPVFLGGDEEVFIGYNFAQSHSMYSEEVIAKVDAEIHRILEESLTACEALLTTHKDQLEAVAQYLLKNEKMDAAAFRAVMVGEPAEPAAPETPETSETPETPAEA